MTRGMVYKLFFILSIIAFSIILILPTIGEKKMEVVFNSDSTTEEVDSVIKRFPADKYRINKRDGSLLIEGVDLHDAIMNEVREFPGVKEAKILPHWAEKGVLAKQINLGLDLQGGMHLIMMADFKKIREQLVSEKSLLLEKMKSLTEKKQGKDSHDKDNEQQLDNLKIELDDINKNKLTDEDELREKLKDEITQQALELLRNRVDKFGVSEPSIRPRGNEAIEIQLPGVKDPKIVKEVLGKTGRVEYRLVDDDYSKKANDWLKANFKEKNIPQSYSEQSELLSKISKEVKLPNNLILLFFFQREKDAKKLIPAYIVSLHRKVSLAGSDISKAWVGKDEYSRLAVHFTATPEGAAKFASVTSEKNHGKRLAIIIDDKVRSQPQLNVQITSGKAIIQGDFSREEVDTLSRIIKEGALPVDLTIVEERTVGPSLGQDSIEFGINAIIVGLLGVVAFMIFYYKLGGIIADIGLMLNMIFMLALLSWLGFTLTLPGIAGFILTVGMAVDANVIIYERIKEELRSGKSVRMSVTNGFDRAFWTIFDANITTLIAAFILSQFGTGPIKGFAVVLFIGIICSMFVALYVTRFIYEIISSNKKIKKLSI